MTSIRSYSKRPIQPGSKQRKKLAGVDERERETLAFAQSRLAPRSEYFKLFLVCIFPVHLWALINLANTVPSMLLLMNTRQMISVVAYVLAFALFESLAIFALLFLISSLMPFRYFGAQLVPLGSMVVIIASIAAALIHFHDSWNIQAFQFEHWAVLWVALALAAIGLAAYLVSRHERVAQIIRSGAERLSLLSFAYLTVDVLGVLVILARNWSWR